MAQRAPSLLMPPLFWDIKITLIVGAIDYMLTCARYWLVKCVLNPPNEAIWYWHVLAPLNR